MPLNPSHIKPRASAPGLSVNPIYSQIRRNSLQNNSFQTIPNLHTIKSKKRILKQGRLKPNKLLARKLIPTPWGPGNLAAPRNFYKLRSLPKMFHVEHFALRPNPVTILNRRPHSSGQAQTGPRNPNWE